MEMTGKPRISSDFMLYKEEGQDECPEIFLFNVKDGQVFQINATSYDFLNLCDGERSLQDIFHEMSQMYSTSIEVLLKDFLPLISQWQEKGIFQEG